MTLALEHTAVRAILLDIEGTTTPLDFVYRVLFPYARGRAKDFLARHSSSEEVRAALEALRGEHAADRHANLNPPPLPGGSAEAEVDSLVAYIHWLMDHDRKATPLKLLQGKIWEEGYRVGELRGQVFADVPPALERWRRQGKRVAIFSSGSVLAQQLLFGHATAGDLTRLIHAYFDTTTGAKTDPESYRRIAAALGRRTAEMVFLSDATAELDAARTAGLKAYLSLRPGNRPPPAGHTHPVIRTFDEVLA